MGRTVERSASQRAIVYDGFGLEGEDPAPVHALGCLGCGAPMAVGLLGLLRGFARVNDLDLETKAPLVVAASLSPSSWSGLPYLRTRDGLEPYVASVRCAQCGARYQVVFGYGEFQPARYLATLEAIVLVPT